MPSASDLFAEITRDQYADWARTWRPFEDKLIEYATDPTVVSGAMSDASTSVNSSFDRQATQTQSRLRGLGLTLNADEQKAADRSAGLARASADVDAQNRVRDQVKARQQSILGTPVPGLGSMPS